MLVFSSPILDDPLFVVGDVSVELEMTTDNPHIDMFVKLCDVDTSGKSWNVAEKMTRLGAKDFSRSSGGGDAAAADAADVGTFDARIVVNLGAVAACFAAGHRVRLQISGGAHPVYLRHHGTTDHPAFTDAMRTSTRRVHHDVRSRMSRVVLPLVDVLPPATA